MKFLNNIKGEKGSITLFVVISMLFFLIVIVGLYINSSYKLQKQDKEIEKIQKSYEYRNINELYNMCEEKFENEIVLDNEL